MKGNTHDFLSACKFRTILEYYSIKMKLFSYFCRYFDRTLNFWIHEYRHTPSRDGSHLDFLPGADDYPLCPYPVGPPAYPPYHRHDSGRCGYR